MNNVNQSQKMGLTKGARYKNMWTPKQANKPRVIEKSELLKGEKRGIGRSEWKGARRTFWGDRTVMYLVLNGGYMHIYNYQNSLN